MRVLLVANPASRSGRGRGLAQRAAARLRAAGVDVRDVLWSERPGHVRAALATPPRDVDRVVACGGDGLVSEAAGALAGSDLPLAIVPTGRGNDLARALGLPLDVDRAADLAVRGAERRIDLGEAGGRSFCTVAACGLDAEVSRRARRSRWPLPGPGVYVMELLVALAGRLGAHVRLEHDGGVLEERALLVAVANTGFYGGGFRIAPAADPSDGLLDACVVRATSRLAALRLFPQVMAGSHVRREGVTLIRSARFRLQAEPALAVEADGEPLAGTPCEYRCRHAALAVVAPEKGSDPFSERKGV